ncbi:MAG TPA: glycosyltransferase family 2 protein [Anaerolineae bacterium]|nr:glycosyltransferase family 2 protein [Anaerolineae bacterium]
MDLSVITVSYNTRELLRACLASVISTLRSTVDCELVVVDNASADGSAAMVREQFSGVRLVCNAENRGFAAASNQGLEQSLGRNLILLNPDTVVRTGALEGMSRVLEERADVGAVGPKLVFPDGGFQHSAFAFPTLPMIFLDFFPLHHRLLDSRLNGRYPREWYERGDPFPIDHPLGAALMVKRTVIDDVGLLDEGFFMYCEEIDWCLRIKQAGWQILCDPQAEVVHHVGQSTGQFKDEMYVELHKSRYRLYEKHYGPLFRRVARWLVKLGISYQERQACHEASKGRLEQGALQRRLQAYREIRALSYVRLECPTSLGD